MRTRRGLSTTTRETTRRRTRAAAALVAGVLGLAATACTGGSPTPDDAATVPPGTVDTLLAPGETIPSDAALPGAVVDHLLADVPEATGVRLDEAATACVRSALSSALTPTELRAIGLDGAVLDQPLSVQGAIYGAFDGCVTPEDFARLGAPFLVAAGATEEDATCVMRTLREELGFAGLFVYGQSLIGEAEPDATLNARVARIYRSCSVDPSALTVPGAGATLPEPPSTNPPPGGVTTSTLVPPTTFPPVVATPSSVQLPPPTTTTTTTTTVPSTAEPLPK